MLENVRGLLRRGFGDVVGDLAADGYDTRWRCVRASDVGAPHRRERIFVVATDAESERRDARGTESARLAGASRATGDRQVATDADGWGQYAEAIERWERICDRRAPAPTLPDGRGGRERLNVAFVEWMMGLPEGWVSDPAIDISRKHRLKALGNGVVPAQAAHAIALLTS